MRFGDVAPTPTMEKQLERITGMMVVVVVVVVAAVAAVVVVMVYRD